MDNRYTTTTGTFYTVGGTNLPFMTLADVDGSGIPEGPTLSVTPTSLSFSLDCGANSPVKQLSIANSGTGSTSRGSPGDEDQAAPEGSWLLLDKASGTAPKTVNVSVKNVSKGNYTGKVRITTTDTAVQNKTVDVAISYRRCVRDSWPARVRSTLPCPGAALVQDRDGQLFGADRLDDYTGAGDPHHLL